MDRRDPDPRDPTAEGITAADLPLPPRLGEPPPLFARLDLPDGGWIRHARWPAPDACRGTVVLLHGRSEFLEKYDGVARAWRERGFQAIGMDWRGQGRSSRLLSEDPPLRQRGHVCDYGLWLDDLARFLEAVAVPEAGRPLVACAHSQGAHLLLRHLARSPRGFDAVVLSAPMTDIYTQPGWVPRPVARALARAGVRLGLGARYLPGQGDYDPARHSFAANPVTSDPASWAVHHQWFRHDPALVVGGVTHGWLDATYRSLAELARPEAAVGVETPMLALVPGCDVVVPPDSQRAACARYRHCRVHVLADAMHEVLMERAEIRAAAWAEVDRFLADALE
ncbi:alpha/beta hydrolase [Arenibaculum sp.]|uniref:alpha/beta hydrolase n=1 Tax=Arenibaculum sp. TaxID=2865862 RepID=UPI002E0D7BEC|nr:alpha/beta hydrolase [Arenibaculum sp.]